MRIGQKVWKIFCGGQTEVTIIARRRGKRENVRIQYPDGKKRWVSSEYILPIKLTDTLIR